MKLLPKKLRILALFDQLLLLSTNPREYLSPEKAEKLRDLRKQVTELL